ncbi:MAG TPA: hypothetical protein K8W00_25440 [Kitasatospora aureofaciens]|uniref:hypothetical protein n=1 Tax=Kitasatospora aureofaciens TaxID=1894 RepID=UPI001D5ABB8A|nr:hypothetical protein [Kitasatospora aureofaciens]HJD84754.1 hypothetical protein [Kitasatospora aureofaciens]
MRMRTLAVAAAGIGAAALATTGITHIPAGSSSASPSVQQAARSAERAALALPSVQQAAQPARQAAPATAVSGGGENGGAEKGGAEKGGAEKGGGEGGEKREGGDRRDGGRGHGHEEAGRIYFNERTYSADTEGCVTAASGAGSTSFSVFNDSRKVVEVYRGFSCDNGSPVTTVGPYGATNGVVTRTGHGNLFGGDGAVGSFRVIGDYDEW